MQHAIHDFDFGAEGSWSRIQTQEPLRRCFWFHFIHLYGYIVIKFVLYSESVNYDLYQAFSIGVVVNKCCVFF